MAPDGVKHMETPGEWLPADAFGSPPGSFLLSEEAKLDWFGSNAFFHRKDSAKSTNINNGNNVSGTRSSTPYSQRLNPRSADFESRGSSIIGLPKLRRPSKKDHRRNPSVSLFPRPDRSTSIEPRSPKVTCIGRVRSRRGRNRVDRPEEPVGGTMRMREGWLVRLSSLVLSSCKEPQTVDPITLLEPVDAGDVDSAAKRKLRGGIDLRSKLPMEVKPGPPCLAGTKGIASGRRSASWGIE